MEEWVDEGRETFGRSERCFKMGKKATMRRGGGVGGKDERRDLGFGEKSESTWAMGHGRAGQGSLSLGAAGLSWRLGQRNRGPVGANLPSEGPNFR
jgi:hypothetical protein